MDETAELGNCFKAGWLKDWPKYSNESACNERCEVRERSDSASELRVALARTMTRSNVACEHMVAISMSEIGESNGINKRPMLKPNRFDSTADSSIVGRRVFVN